MALAPCGLDCSLCALYQAANDLEKAALLVPWFRRQGWIQPGDGATEIMAKGPFCMGCLGDRRVQWSGDCAIRSCCTDERHLPHCGVCADFPCARLEQWARGADHHAQALAKLRAIGNRRD